jgi:hypothetical protein
MTITCIKLDINNVDPLTGINWGPGDTLWHIRPSNLWSSLFIREPDYETALAIAQFLFPEEEITT